VTIFTPPGLCKKKLAWPRKVTSTVPGAVTAARCNCADLEATAGEQPAASAGATRANRMTTTSNRTILASTFINEHGMAAQPPRKIGDDVGDRAGARQRQTSRQQGELAGAVAVRRGFHDGVEGALVAVAKHRERCFAVL